ncbi:MAG: hypothetical protein P8Y45_10435 [Exilibacterium sp.]
MKYSILGVSALSTLLCLSGCDLSFGGDSDDDDNGRGNQNLPATLETLQNEVFTPLCADCHGGDEPEENLRLDTERNSFDDLVGRRSTQRVSIDLVEPGFTDKSYIVFKVEGVVAEIIKDKMPPNTNLTSTQIGWLRDWIANNAPLVGEGNTAAKVSAAEAMVTATNTITFSFRFSFALDRTTLDRDTVLVFAEVGGVEQSVDFEFYELSFVNRQVVEIDLSLPDSLEDFESIRVVLNDPSVAAVMDENGLLLDGDRDNDPGGVFEFIFTGDDN